MQPEVKKYIEIEYLNVLPFTQDKRPVGNWSKYQTEPAGEEIFDDYTGNYIGIVTGYGNVECIDFDLKVLPEDQRAQTYAYICDYVAETYPDIFQRIYIETTMNNGYHWIYRTDNVGPNEKLARNGTPNAIIETRGRGGCVVIAPSTGYTAVSGNLIDLPILQSDIARAIKDFLRTLDIAPEQPHHVAKPKAQTDIKSDIWTRIEQLERIEDVLAHHGWYVSNWYRANGHERAYVRRPNATSKWSGNIVNGHAKQILYVHSTGSNLPDNTPLSVCDVIAYLAFNGNKSEMLKSYAKQPEYSDLDKYSASQKASTRTDTKPKAEDKPTLLDTIFQPYSYRDCIEEMQSIGDPIDTGIHVIADVNLKLRRNGITVVGAKSNHGKTLFMLNLAHKLYQQGRTILYLSYEQPEAELYPILIAIDKKEAIEQVELDMHSEKDPQEKYADIFNKILIRSFNETVTKEELYELVRNVQSKAGKETVIFFDYIQAIYEPNVQKFDLIEGIMSNMYLIAKTEKLPLVMGSQLTRNVNTYTDLTMEAISEGHHITQKASTVIALWNNRFAPKADKEGYHTEYEIERRPSNKTLYVKVLKSRQQLNTTEMLYHVNKGNILLNSNIANFKEFNENEMKSKPKGNKSNNNKSKKQDKAETDTQNSRFPCVGCNGRNEVRKAGELCIPCQKKPTPKQPEAKQEVCALCERIPVSNAGDMCDACSIEMKKYLPENETN